jgi:hypothetical protein
MASNTTKATVQNSKPMPKKGDHGNRALNATITSELMINGRPFLAWFCA